MGSNISRHGTLSLYAALDVNSGHVEGKTAARHTADEFVDLLGRLATKSSWAQEIHVILDNLWAHKTKKVEELLKANPKVKLHFTPMYSSWLNQVEIWFSKTQRDVIDRGIFSSVADLKRKLMRYIKSYAKTWDGLLD
jgi:hypothetical protein